MKRGFAIVLCVFALGCSSKPVSDKEEPAWVQGPARVVDNGYIVYVGTGEDTELNRAQFIAESIAVQDLANECSFVPKGTRIEDRFNRKLNYTYQTYAKVAVEFQLCDQAKKTVDPVEIKNLASLSYTEQLKKYQETIEEGRNKVVDSGISADDVAPKDEFHYYVVRQYVAYQKQEVILSPPTAYAANSVESQTFVKSVQPATTQIQQYETQTPMVKATPMTWSRMETKVKADRPQAFAQPSSAKRASPLLTPRQPPKQPRAIPNRPKVPKLRKKRRQDQP